MTWADYSGTTKKAKIHLGFNVNQGLPGKFCLTHGKGDEGPLVPQLLSPGQTGIMDRNYQFYRTFYLWQEQGLQFVCDHQGRHYQNLPRNLCGPGGRPGVL